MIALQRWQNLCQQLGIGNSSAIEQEFDRIIVAYGEAHRAYHTAQHINECLELLDWARGHSLCRILQSPVLEIALWYHDVVYQPQGPDKKCPINKHQNERQSANQAIAFLQAYGRLPQRVKQDHTHRVESLIMATSHFTDNESGELTDWILDIDLAILGTSPQRFLEYNTQIRQEYSEIPITVYEAKRQVLLAQFLRRSTIYRSALFRERFETQAQENLSTLIHQEIR
ncbi:MAG: hypothetical protein AAF572_21680 [Cyanobacteria bacterium P01_B01_bin.77]